MFEEVNKLVFLEADPELVERLLEMRGALTQPLRRDEPRRASSQPPTTSVDRAGRAPAG